MFEFDSPQNAPQDALFLERLEAFMDRSLADLRAFSERENVSFNEVKQYNVSSCFAPAQRINRRVYTWQHGIASISSNPAALRFPNPTDRHTVCGALSDAA